MIANYIPDLAGGGGGGGSQPKAGDEEEEDGGDTSSPVATAPWRGGGVALHDAGIGAVPTEADADTSSKKAAKKQKTKKRKGERGGGGLSVLPPPSLSFHCPLQRFLGTLLLSEHAIVNGANNDTNVGANNGTDDGATAQLLAACAAVPRHGQRQLMEAPLRCVVFAAQVQVGMWRRNGDETMQSQMMNYWEGAMCRNFYDLDVSMLQACAHMLGGDTFVATAIDRFGGGAYLRRSVNPPPLEGNAGAPAPTVSIDQQRDLVMECLRFVSVMCTELLAVRPDMAQGGGVADDTGVTGITGMTAAAPLLTAAPSTAALGGSSPDGRADGPPYSLSLCALRRELVHFLVLRGRPFSEISKLQKAKARARRKGAKKASDEAELKAVLDAIAEYVYIKWVFY